MGKPGLPKYGKNFYPPEPLPWNPYLDLAPRIYVLRADPAWFIRSDKKSKNWQVYHGRNRDTATPMGKVVPTLRLAMQRLLSAIDMGFYEIEPPPGDEPVTCPQGCTQPSLIPGRGPRPAVCEPVYASVDGDQPVATGWFRCRMCGGEFDPRKMTDQDRRL